jgi:type II secretory pathway component PulJ
MEDIAIILAMEDKEEQEKKINRMEIFINRLKDLATWQKKEKNESEIKQFELKERGEDMPWILFFNNVWRNLENVKKELRERKTISYSEENYIDGWLKDIAQLYYEVFDEINNTTKKEGV